MLTGRVVQFDESRGYGFIAPDNGGEDVFVHVNVLGNDRWAFGLGVPVEFQAVEGDRGAKALSARVIGDAANGSGNGAAAAGGNGRPAVAPTPATAASNGAASNGAATAVLPRPTSASPAPAAPPTEDNDDGMCDVLSERALHSEIGEALLSAVPDLTAGQVVAVRQEMLALARRHGWTETD